MNSLPFNTQTNFYKIEKFGAESTNQIFPFFFALEWNRLGLHSNEMMDVMQDRRE